MADFNVKVASISNRAGNGSVSFSEGIVGVGCSISGFISVSGISTLGSIQSTHCRLSGVSTAGYYKGDGSGLTNLTTTTKGLTYGIKLVIGDPPLRA